MTINYTIAVISTLIFLLTLLAGYVAGSIDGYRKGWRQGQIKAYRSVNVILEKHKVITRRHHD